jgi:hypothetical protein
MPPVVMAILLQILAMVTSSRGARWRIHLIFIATLYSVFLFHDFITSQAAGCAREPYPE